MIEEKQESVVASVACGTYTLEFLRAHDDEPYQGQLIVRYGDRVVFDTPFQDVDAESLYGGLRAIDKDTVFDVAKGWICVWYDMCNLLFVPKNAAPTSIMLLVDEWVALVRALRDFNPALEQH